MKLSKKFVIGAFWVVGLILISLATFNLSLSLPSVDSSIAENQEKIQLQYTTDFALKNEIDFAALDRAVLSMMLHSGFNSSNGAVLGLFLKLHTIYQQSLGYIEILDSGKRPSDEQKIQWQNMNLSEITEEADLAIRKMVDGDRKINDLFIERDALAKQKKNLQFWTIIFQLIGLLFTQFGTLLELAWKAKQEMP